MSVCGCVNVGVMSVSSKGRRPEITEGRGEKREGFRGAGSEGRGRRHTPEEGGKKKR